MGTQAVRFWKNTCMGIKIAELRYNSYSMGVLGRCSQNAEMYNNPYTWMFMRRSNRLLPLGHSKEVVIFT